MDSLTQITLGAAVGELVLGKKLGNRAMLWGGIAGTIPDLDVIGNQWMSPVEALAFHRGISHSIFFAVLFPLLLAWLVSKYYERDRFTLKINSGLIEKPTYQEWYLLFFLGMFTHAILDCFTSYGTQLFAPFTNYKVVLGNIAVADFFYTLPFIFCLVMAMRFGRKNLKRKMWTWLGVGISSAYMIFTLFNKLHVTNVMQQTIKTDNIEAERFILNPGLLSNFMWSGTIETTDGFYHGTYSIFDKEPFFKLNQVPKQRHLIADAKPDDQTINTIKWFCDDYHICLIREDGQLQINDFRYGNFGGNQYGENDFIFRFLMRKNDDGYYEMIKSDAGPPMEKRMNVFGDIWERVKGVD